MIKVSLTVLSMIYYSREGTGGLCVKGIHAVINRLESVLGWCFIIHSTLIIGRSITFSVNLTAACIEILCPTLNVSQRMPWKTSQVTGKAYYQKCYNTAQFYWMTRYIQNVLWGEWSALEIRISQVRFTSLRSGICTGNRYLNFFLLL